MPSLPEIGSSLAEVAFRTAVVYTFLVIALRIGGKREIGQLSILDLIVLLVIADAVQNAMVGENTTLWGGLVAAGTLLALDKGLKLLAQRSREVKRVLEGEPRLLIRNGKFLERAMREEGIDREELKTAVRSHGLAKVGDVALAVLERDGTISVIPREAEPQTHPRRILP
ncbi:MAG: DUF421 domain-containing protein [Chloroflexota bacterium]|nr:DUF421 domain-containing protein [Chloroflexota bacterium]